MAIKTLNNDASMTDRIKFLQEAAIMGQFRHPNVVALYGVAKKNGNYYRDIISYKYSFLARMIIVELLTKGDLCAYLIDLRPE